MGVAHSRLAPSAADRWVFCPASVRLSEQFPRLVEDPSAAEGTASHWAGYSLIKTHSPKAGDTCPENGVQLTEEMLEGALLYFNTAFAITNSRGGFGAASFEETLPAGSLSPEVWGTPDMWFWDAVEGVLTVLDYKFGHRDVSPVENWQLVLYVRLVLDKMGFNGLEEQHVKVRFVIVQPRSYHRDGPVRFWECKASDLRAMWNRASAAADEALTAVNPTFKANPEYCRDCPGRRACPTFTRNVQAAMDLAASSLPSELSPSELGVELMYRQRAFEFLKAGLEALKQQAETSIHNGVSVQGHGLEPGRGSTKWEVPTSEVKLMGSMFGVDLLKAPEPVTPKQAEQLFAQKGLDQSVIAAYSKRIPGSLRLVRSEKTLAHRVFGKGN